MTTELLLIPAAALGLWIALVLVLQYVGWLRLRRARFGPGRRTHADRAAMPADVRALLDSAAAPLAALGFRHETTLMTEVPLRSGHPPPVWSDRYYHPEARCWASAQPAETPEPGALVAVTFVSLCGGRVLQTVNRRAHQLFPLPAPYEVADALAPTLAEQWAFHARRVAAAGAPALDDRAQLDRHEDYLQQDLLQDWQAMGYMHERAGAWALTARGAWRYQRQLAAGMRRVARLAPPAEADDARLRVLADAKAWHAQEALLASLRLSLRAKAAWFLASACLGAAAFGLLTSWEYVPVVVGVLLFHEFGHALAMRGLGYQGLHVLMIPFLGAVAIGRKDDAGPWQKLAVLLAGPVPGLLLAVACLRFAQAQPGQYPLLLGIGLSAFAINLFNLLPFAPLDGGQILATFAFARRPHAQFVFFSASTLALVVVGWWLHSPALAGAGLVLALFVPRAWKRVRRCAQLAGTAPGADPVTTLLERLHDPQAPIRASFNQRLAMVRALLPELRGRVPSLRESVVGLAIYLAAIGLPIAALWDTGLPEAVYATLMRKDAPSAPAARAHAPPDWDARLERAATPAQRWQVLMEAGDWYAEEDETDQARRRYEAARAEADRLPPGLQRDLLHIDARLGLARVADDSNAALAELLPMARALPPAAGWRVAHILAWQDQLDSVAPASVRIARLGEAVAAREAAQSAALAAGAGRSAEGGTQAGENEPALLQGRIQLARLRDAQGDAAGAEALLERNARMPVGHDCGGQLWVCESQVWFFIAHGRAAEAEAWLRERGAAEGARPLRHLLAWTLMEQGRSPEARRILEEEWNRIDPARTGPHLRASFALDLVHASADDPERLAHWTSEAERARAALGRAFPRFLHGLREAAATDAWERRRARARLDAAERVWGPSAAVMR